jgi:hypothetical protein
MTLAIMTRACLGHTGQPLTAGPLTQSIYAAVVIAAILRIVATVLPGATILLLHCRGRRLDCGVLDICHGGTRVNSTPFAALPPGTALRSTRHGDEDFD